MTVDGVKKRSPEQGRIVITLEYDVPRSYWHQYAEGRKITVTDAVDCLRLNVQDWEAGELSLAELIDGASEISVTATK
ncbi:hypothetical protein SEA_LUMOS_55 [Mycobacterium phage Lumos]|uniref:Uncharacterized protein n=1 Tax=Mycobacterium phage Lumos TaxID=1701852 RepID=A0A0K2CLX0_9CAUD|nr:hypothetical protein AVU96_gp127 [Mycobacterium phage Snenia]YP_010012512.1 hypothetical protein J4T93_gp124 [Mycobacterium phage Lumos]ASM62790.1 hypothetical protein SEA_CLAUTASTROPHE_53 [Mycobacterium phage Clautastrophe]QDF16637.1 hypothetical protein PBI_MSGREEN_53 [Mycobacterium phage MsGreen]QPL14936.1 hypothetical protein SEA_JUBIE_53 [Mycobacterium phage Jubie]QZD99241.1 hypothetical protein SEA_MOOSTARD_53 [Mycobacterium phage Moostard]ALA06570.1 hypothetical protein SEA_LUMOS_55